jgi:hypothetical protein
MLRLLCACALLSSFTGCYYSMTIEDPEAMQKLSDGLSVEKSDRTWNFRSTKSADSSDLTVVVAGKSYKSTVKGTVKEEANGQQLVWLDVDDNQHRLTSNAVIPYVVHSSREMIPGDKVTTPSTGSSVAAK